MSEWTREEVKEAVLRDMTKFVAPRGVLGSSKTLNDFLQVCKERIAVYVGVGLEDLGHPVVDTENQLGLHLDKYDVPTIKFDLLYPKIGVAIEIIGKYQGDMWCYYPRVVPESEWTADRKISFGIWDKFGSKGVGSHGNE
ncbi:hypothetical protein Goe20_02510 [Bacillus phage vB_BsuM-Goe20]|nr:hypothetical protein Goe20_00020 [Bacillus phage vB_BsuM-Goe20]WCS69368.1 hypothetical protein Goe20_02510 [Bacillus phage vB_BsuM-Goe20]